MKDIINFLGIIIVSIMVGLIIFYSCQKHEKDKLLSQASEVEIDVTKRFIIKELKSADESPTVIYIKDTKTGQEYLTNSLYIGFTKLDQ